MISHNPQFGGASYTNPLSRRCRSLALSLACLLAAVTCLQAAPSVDVHDTNTLALSGYSNSNFVDLAASLQGERKADLQTLFNLARRQRLQKNYPQAAKNFAAVLERDPPEDMRRKALLELALVAEGDGQLAKAQQILAQYIKLYPADPELADVTLRQGLIYRRMGASTLALSKFYSVISSALSVKPGNLERYKRLVLVAQTEIADTYYLEGRYAEAAEYFQRMLKLEASDLNTGQIRYKIIRCMAAQGRHPETVAQANDFLNKHLSAPERGEVQFFLATALKQQGRNREALQQVLSLLKEQRQESAGNRDDWPYWQQRTGNEIANQLYQEGDFPGALEIYNTLIAINSTPAWRIPVSYQIGVIYERLQQPKKAIEMYKQIQLLLKDVVEPTPNLSTVAELAKWRSDLLEWNSKMQTTIQNTARPL